MEDMMNRIDGLEFKEGFSEPKTKLEKYRVIYISDLQFGNFERVLFINAYSYNDACSMFAKWCEKNRVVAHIRSVTVINNDYKKIQNGEAGVIKPVGRDYYFYGHRKGEF